MVTFGLRCVEIVLYSTTLLLPKFLHLGKPSLNVRVRACGCMLHSQQFPRRPELLAEGQQVAE